MKAQPSSSIKNTSLFRLYDIEQEYQKHKKKICNIKNRNAKQKVKKQYSSQVNAANDLKKNWLLSQTGRMIQKERQISQQNQILYNQIVKTRSRPFDTRPKVFSESHIVNASRLKTSHSVNRQNDRKTIQKENQKLMEKILMIKSPLSKEKMNQSYRKIKQAKKRLESYSSVNKSRIQKTLTKFNLKPKIYFPDIGMTPNQSKKQNLDLTRRSRSTQKVDKMQNQFLPIDTVQKDNFSNLWRKQQFIPQGLSSHTKKKFSKTKFDSSRKISLNKTNS